MDGGSGGDGGGDGGGGGDDGGDGGGDADDGDGGGDDDGDDNGGHLNGARNHKSCSETDSNHLPIHDHCWRVWKKLRWFLIIY